MNNFLLDQINSPLGKLLLVCKQDALVSLEFNDAEARMQRLLQSRFGDYDLQPGNETLGIKKQLADYFAGNMLALNNLVVFFGGSEIQNKVWQALRQIPAGQTRSYAELGRSININNARLIGQVNGQNPIGIVVPCHRVIGADGSLTGYAGGLERKRWLLEFEGALAQTTMF